MNVFFMPVSSVAVIRRIRNIVGFVSQEFAFSALWLSRYFA